MDVTHVQRGRRSDGSAAAASSEVSGKPKAKGKGLRRIVSQLAALKTFLRDYKKKKPTDPDPVTFGYGGSYLDAAAAVDVIRHHHIHWCKLIDERATGRRVSSLPSSFHGYQYACDAARQAWTSELQDGEALGANAGADAADDATKGLWVQVDADAAPPVGA